MKRSYSTYRHFVISDTHFQAPLKNNSEIVSPVFCHDPKAISIVAQILCDCWWNEVTHIGDIAELGMISEWQRVINREGQVKGEDGKWYETAWADTMAQVTAFWDYIASVLPDAKKHQLEGNHDFWCEVLFTQPRFKPFESLLHIRKLPVWNRLGIDYKSYDGDQKKDQPWVDDHQTRLLHGYKNVSVTRMLREHDNVFYGHQHKVLYHSWDASSREMRQAWCIGCLTKLKPDYNSRGGAQNGWAQAFGVIYTLPNGKQWKEVVRIQEGECLFEGKLYRAKPLSKILAPLAV
jgi:hypothetical protein